MVAGGHSVARAVADRDLVCWVRDAARSARRVTSVCSGALLLAHAGVLDGRRATTHWAACDALAAGYPSVEVETEPIYVHDGNVWTSAGATAGMDLALALVEHDHGADLALTVAREMVMFVHRPGRLPQISAQLEVRRPGPTRSTAARTCPSSPTERRHPTAPDGPDGRRRGTGGAPSPDPGWAGQAGWWAGSPLAGASIGRPSRTAST